MENAIEIYKTQGGTEIQVRLANQTIWLDAHLIAQLFDVQRPAVVKHIQNIYQSAELDESATCSKMEQVAADGKARKMNLYNLDMIISIGYRVNSKKATQFRQWATQRLKDYLVQGYALNEKRLAELAQTVQIIQQSLENQAMPSREAQGLLQVLGNYTQSYILLNQFDSNTLLTDHLTEHITYEIAYPEAKQAIGELKNQLIALKEATELFGNEKDDSFQGILGNIVQTFGGQYLYPSIEEQAAHLLYFIIKNHPFSDGNKRIGAFMLVWFLEKNKHRFKKNGELKINDNALVAIALLVAQSDPADKELLVKLIINLIKS